MPEPPKRRCTSPGCPTPVVKGRCEKHRLHHKQQRDTWSDLYGPEWPTIRLDFLERHPVCSLCPRMARVADHYPVGIKRLRQRKIANPHADRYLRPLCWPCHSKATARAQPSGFMAFRG